jgi:hypothetical protein
MNDLDNKFLSLLLKITALSFHCYPKKLVLKSDRRDGEID